jgi:hypothetical protein
MLLTTMGHVKCSRPSFSFQTELFPVPTAGKADVESRRASCAPSDAPLAAGAPSQHHAAHLRTQVPRHRWIGLI